MGVRTTAAAAALSLVAVSGYGAGGGLHPRLHPLADFVGKTYRGEFSNSTPGKPVVDVQRWERALGGQAIRIVHSINDGEYGGETLLFWDEKQQSLVYYYFTTAGFFTHGTMQPQAGGFVAHELVEGDAEGVSEVRSTSKRLEGGRVETRAEYRKNGEWTAGHSVVYSEAPDAEPRFH